MMSTQGSRRIRIGAVGILVGLCVAVAPQLRAQSDPSLGTWKLNVAKSKYSPGPAPASETRVYEVFAAGGVKATFNRVDASGKKLTISYSAKRIDANTVESIQKLNGKVIQTTRAVVSPDGKVRTITATGPTPSGQKINNLIVLDKQ